MTIEILSTVTVETTNSGDHTFDHTTDAGTDCLVYALGTWRGSGSTVVGVTYNGASMTQIVTDVNANNERATLLRQLAPSIGTASVNVVMSDSGEIQGGLFNLSGVDQTDPTGGINSDTDGGDDNPNIDVASSVGDLVVAGIAVYNLTSTPDSPAFEILSDNNGGGNDSHYCIGQDGEADSTNIGSTLSASDNWCIVGTAFQPAAGGTAIEPGSGALAMAGQAVSLAAATTLAIEAGASSISGQSAAVALGTGIAPQAATLALIGQGLTLSVGVTLLPERGGITIAGQQVALGRGGSLDPGTAVIGIAGQELELVQAVALGVDRATISIDGQSAQVVMLRSLEIGRTTILINGQAVEVDAVFADLPDGKGLVLPLVSSLVKPINRRH